MSVLLAYVLGVRFLQDSFAWVNACEIQLARETHLPVYLANAHCVVEFKRGKLVVDIQNSGEGWRVKLTLLFGCFVKQNILRAAERTIAHSRSKIKPISRTLLSVLE